MSQNSQEKDSAEKNYPDHWMEGIIRRILERKSDVISLSTGKTPSGHVHVGILRELLICEGLRRILASKNQKVKYRLFFDSLDAAKRFPDYIPKEYGKNAGRPFALIPNPFQNDGRSFAKFFADELTETFPELGINVEIMWTHELYRTKEMQDKIRIGLKRNDEVKQIIAQFLTATMDEEGKDDFLKQQETWMGAMVICEKCQSTQKKDADGIVVNRAISYDEKNDSVTYECQNCHYKGSVQISSGNVKLNWRLDWPAKWSIFKTTCEPAGKDHCTPNGSYDTGLELCRKIYGYEGPLKVPYEWLRLGDTDMGTSKGIAITPGKYLDMADPEIIRMLIYQTNPDRHISFRFEELPQYYNELERLERVYFGIEKGASPEEEKEIKYIFPIIQSKEVPTKYSTKLSFKFLTQLAQLQSILGEEGIYQKAKDFMKREKFEIIISKDIFMKKINRAFNWVKEMEATIKNEKDPETLKKLKNKVEIFSFPDTISDEIKKSLEPIQKDAFKLFLAKIQPLNELTEDNVNEVNMAIQKELNIKAMKFFSAFYSILLGTKQGPRLGSFLSMLDKNWIEKRIAQVI